MFTVTNLERAQRHRALLQRLAAENSTPVEEVLVALLTDALHFHAITDTAAQFDAAVAKACAQCELEFQEDPHGYTDRSEAAKTLLGDGK